MFSLSRARVAASVLAVLLAASTTRAALAGPVYPLHASADGRYLLDQANVPFLLTGESPQAMVVNVGDSDTDLFFADRASHGFNTAWINLLCTTYTGGRVDASLLDGTRPFTANMPGKSSYDLTTPNEAYFARVDRVIALAAAHGTLVLLDPIETGGFLATMRDNGHSRCRAYGRFLGARYGAADNILWMSGNDFQTWRDSSDDGVVRAVATGIREADTRHLQTTELDYLASSSLDDPAWSALLGVNATYTYYPTYARLRDDYNRSPHLPNVMIEANYEFENLQGPLTTAAILRKQEYWTMTSGAAGQLYGNTFTWRFTQDWKTHLDSPGAVEMTHLRALLDPRPWYDLVPDVAHTVVTGGYGTFSSIGHVSDNDFLTAARTPDGALVLVYTPIVRTFTVDLRQLSAAATTRWFDPSAGTFTTIAGSPFANSGPHDFTPPGNNADGDGGWVLVLETRPPETQAPVASLTLPARGATVTGIASIAASASDNVGVAGVQFQLDGATLGSEDSTPPYEFAWSTATVSNGPHLLAAVARDAAGNRGSDTLTVIVSNAAPPPPVDHLVAAYAFDETGGTRAADVSGAGNHVSLHGLTFAAGHRGNALTFGGTTGYAEAPSTPSLDVSGTGLTIAFWVKVHSTTSGIDGVVIGKPWNATTAARPYYQYGVEYANAVGKTLDFYFGDPAGAVHGPHRMTPIPGQWTFAAFTFDGTTVRGYLDGTLRFAEPDAGSIAARGNTLRFGVDGGFQQFFNGALDDLRIYTRALTPTELVSAMQTPVLDTARVGDSPVIGARARLFPARPNPFRAGTRIVFDLAVPLTGNLAVFDAAGRRVRVLASGTFSAGPHGCDWDGFDTRGESVRAGSYFARLLAGHESLECSIVRIR